MPTATEPISPSLRAFLAGLVDYAGMFPPASLPLTEALKNYLTYLSSVDSWILARFVCPASKIHGLRSSFESVDEAPPLRVSIVASSSEDRAGYNDHVAAALSAVGDLYRSGQVAVEAIELRMPDSLAGAPESVMRNFLASLNDRIQRDTHDAAVFVEPPRQPTPLKDVETVIAAVNYSKVDAPKARLGIKFRCGGESERQVPTVPDLASALFSAIRAEVPFKATAGLHHPFRHYNAEDRMWMHGFVNLFAAALLGSRHELEPPAIEEILSSTQPNDFTFEDSVLSWRGLEIGISEIKDLRAEQATSFGSCSFDEPRDDLRALGYM